MRRSIPRSAALALCVAAVASAQDGPVLVRRFDAPEEARSSYPREIARTRSTLTVALSDGYAGRYGLVRVRDASTPPEVLRSPDLPWDSYHGGAAILTCEGDCAVVAGGDVRRVGHGGPPRTIFDFDGTSTRAVRVIGEARGLALFAVDDETEGPALWRTDGTPEGTWRLLDVDATQAGAGVTVGSVLFFQAETPAHGRELWRSDGTAVGTVLVADLRPGTVSSSPVPLARLGGELLVAGAAARGIPTLWITDGSREGARVLADGITPNGSGLALDGVRVFPARDDGRERTRRLWRTDGTPQGTFALGEIDTDVVAAAGRAWFAGRVGDAYGLWRTDGSDAGTERVWPSADATEHADIWNVAALGDGVVFRTLPRNDGSSLWRTDGTVEGTWSILTPADGVEVVRFPAFNGAYDFGSVFAATENAVFFSGARGGETELWVTDGTREGTREVDLAPDRAPALHELEAGADTLYVAATEEDTGREVWTSDGTGAGTAVLTTIGPDADPSFAGELTALGDGIVFVADSPGVPGSELWAGDASGAARIASFANARSQDRADLLVAIEHLVYFRAIDDAGSHVAHRTDGTTAGTLALGGGFPLEFADLDGTTLFFTDVPPRDAELWRTDGTPGGTELVRGFRPSESRAAAGGAVVHDGLLFFGANADARGHALWSSDGTFGGTMLDADLLPAESGNPYALEVVGDDLYFIGFDADRRRTLYVRWADGSVTRLPVVTAGFETARVGERLLFVGEDGEPWVSDGTETGTRRLREIEPGAQRSNPRDFVDVGRGRVVFVATDSEHGSELWTSDGTREGTLLVADLVPGPAGSAPREVTVRGDDLYVVTDGDGPARDLWRIPLAYLDTLEEEPPPPGLPLQPLADPGPIGPEPAPAPPPADGELPEGPPDPLMIDDLRLRVRGPASSDVRLSCRVPLAGDRHIDGNYVIVDVGGVSAEVVLNRRGRGKTVDDRRVRARALPRRRGKPRMLRVVLRIRRGDLEGALADEDLELPFPGDATEVERPIDVHVEWRRSIHRASASVRYRERRGDGVATLID